MSMIPEVFDEWECDELYEERFFQILHQVDDERDIAPSQPKSSFSITVASPLTRRIRRVITSRYSYPLDYEPLEQGNEHEFSEVY